MEDRKKRSLLARIEGQLDRLGADPSGNARHWRRIQWAMSALAGLPRDSWESARLDEMRAHIETLANRHNGCVNAPLARHLAVLVRADCLLWQLHLSRSARPPLQEVA